MSRRISYFHSKERICRRENFLNENPLRQGFVAVQDRKVVGFVDAGPSREPNAAIGEIYAIYLLQGYQKQGIRKQLWEKAAQHLSTNQLIPFIVWGLAQNLKARAFYEKQGANC
ncbi:MAG TPA: GNAT family N-acetyltransferase [Candidatus Nitrosotenuis sp.]|nr:GNAT family N-acetyltransferase [Candidatus Nitrosotenuis sp.]